MDATGDLSANTAHGGLRSKVRTAYVHIHALRSVSIFLSRVLIGPHYVDCVKAFCRFTKALIMLWRPVHLT